MNVNFGRLVYGLAAIAFGIITLVWHDFNTWQQIRVFGNSLHCEILVYVAAAIEIFGGIAIQWRRTARAGAIALGTPYLVFVLLWVPDIVATPPIYDRWGNFFEQFSLVSGALIVYAMCGQNNSKRAAKIAMDWVRWLWNLCGLLDARATHLSFRDCGLRSKVDSWRTDVLGNSDDDCVCTSGHCITFRALRAARISIADGYAGWFRLAGMAVGAFCRSTPTAELGG